LKEERKTTYNFSGLFSRIAKPLLPFLVLFLCLP